MAVFQLDNELWFPDPHQGEKDGLIAVGGDLSVDRLLLAYSYGFFPWFFLLSGGFSAFTAAAAVLHRA